ncbi:hypothetical protein BKP56_09270 [Marinilactibacillus sp. 15R]|uniref:head-tail connector protein n=1 Tax=Marinilactibacillus sp. 15R TaxID=1911586 RepID=UPI000909C592|nr:head-tail connector protein [Marinilactibacillus sp. 15R]API89431.1 hypothetical protein BKP56_09270 [Marinilactibacillus sp. 15R]
MLNVNDDLEEIKISMKIDTDDDDVDVKRAFNTAVASMKGAIGRDKPSFYTQNDEINDLLNTAAIMLADHFYKTRSATIESGNVNGTLREYDLGYTSLLLLLKAEYKVFEEGVSDGA